MASGGSIRKASKGMPIVRQDYKGGMKTPVAQVGEVNPEHSLQGRIAKKAVGSMMGRSRDAGMMLDFMPPNSPSAMAGSINYGSSYRNSYVDGADWNSGANDIPQYFRIMNAQNGGILYFPVTLREKYSWYRYWTRTDAYIGRALELLCDLPMSKITLNMPRMDNNPELRKEINSFYTYMVEKLGLFENLQYLLWEYNMIGNCFILAEWDDKQKIWDRLVFLPPEEVAYFQYPFSTDAWVEYRPAQIMRLVASLDDTQGVTDEINDIEKKIVEHVPQDIKKMIKEKGCIVFDTDPMTGTFVKHIARRKSPYHDLGVSVLERVLVPMLQKEHYRYTQLSLASRNMTPKNLITAPGLMPEELDDLRVQVDLSYMDPEYAIVTNYEVTWEQMGADNRLLDLQREYETIESQVFAALGVTRELLTGEGAFSGSKITIEILNTMFLLTRDILQNFVEKCLFLPVADAHGWYEEDSNGIRKYFYPKLGFNRLTIRDNSEVFDSLFQLYQKGSLPIDVIYELFNLNTEDLHERIYEDLFTVKDTTFNRLVEEVNSEIGRGLVERSDIMEKVAKYLKVELKPAEGEEGGGEDDGFGGFGGFGDEGEEPESEPEGETPEEGEEGEAPEESEEGGFDVDALAEKISLDLPDDASDEDIDEAINKAAGESEE